MRKLKSLVVLSAMSFTAAAASSFSDLGIKFTDQLQSLVDVLRNIVPIVSLGLFIFAGLVYAIGQVFDAGTRQKAQNWAMAMITGGIIGFLLVIIAPWIVQFLVDFQSA